jgi:hypothetical protein
VDFPIALIFLLLLSGISISQLLRVRACSRLTVLLSAIPFLIIGFVSAAIFLTELGEDHNFSLQPVSIIAIFTLIGAIVSARPLRGELRMLSLILTLYDPDTKNPNKTPDSREMIRRSVNKVRTKHSRFRIPYTETPIHFINC